MTSQNIGKDEIIKVSLLCNNNSSQTTFIALGIIHEKTKKDKYGFYDAVLFRIPQMFVCVLVFFFFFFFFLFSFDMLVGSKFLIQVFFVFLNLQFKMASLP